jgi:hypothetical protein
LGEGVELGVKNGPIQICTIGFLLAPYSDQSAISNRFGATQQRHRQINFCQINLTDRQTDRIKMAIATLMLRADALASVAKITVDILLTEAIYDVINCDDKFCY